MNEFKRPRFILAMFFTVTTTMAFLFTDKMSSDQYITVLSIVLGMYTTTVAVSKFRS